MDRYTSKRAIDGMILSRKGSGHVFRDAVNNRDRNPQLCNRLGCSGRVNSQSGVQSVFAVKGKSPRPSVLPASSGKELVGTCSKAYCSSSNTRKSLRVERKTLYSHLETDSSETSSVQDEPEVLKLIHPPEKIQRGLSAESKRVESSNVMVIGSSVGSKSGLRRNFNTGLRNQDVVAGSSMSLGSRNTGQLTNVESHKSGLKNFRCNSILDAIPQGCSSSKSNPIRRKDTIKKRNLGGESSLTSRGKKIIGSASEAWNASSQNGVSIAKSSQSRSTTLKRDNAATSARTRRTNNSHIGVRISSKGNESSGSPDDTPLLISPLLDSDELHSSSLSPVYVSSETSKGHDPNSFSRPGSSSERICTITPFSSGEVSITRALVNRDNIRRFNVDGIAEVLLALERIEHDEELSHEQMLVLETNLFLNSLTFYDQHRDLRLDIDNMSYEELLALEERMGTVSTALTEEALAESLKKKIHQSSPSYDSMEGCDGNGDEIKCSICQEEYIVGDEVGNLPCEHRYHTVCIQQWLRLKNWCPICKASAATSKSVMQS